MLNVVCDIKRLFRFYYISNIHKNTPKSNLFDIQIVIFLNFGAELNNSSLKKVSTEEYYIYRMKATILIIFVLVAQVLADSPHMYFDGIDPEEYESSIDSMPIIADSVTKLFSLPDSSLIHAATDAYSFEAVFNPIRDSLILFYAEHLEEPLDSLRQEVLLNWSCQSLKEHSKQTKNAYRMQRDTLSRKERRKYLQLMDRQLDSVANVCHLGIYGRSQLGYYTPRRFFALDLSFLMAMPTIDDSFNKIRFYGGDISVKATTSKGDFGLGFSVGFGKNEGDDIHYEDIYHKGGETAGGVAPYISYGYPVLDNTDHRIIPTVKLCYYSGSSGDESIPAEDDTHKQFFYSLGIRYEYTVNAPVDKEDYHKGLLHDAVFATINFGFDVNMYAADVIAIRAFIGLGLGLFS